MELRARREEKASAEWCGGGETWSHREGGADDFMYKGGTGGGVNAFFPSRSTLPFGSFPNFNIWREMITLAKLPK